jgi:hypothetical protein
MTSADAFDVSDDVPAEWRAAGLVAAVVHLRWLGTPDYFVCGCRDVVAAAAICLVLNRHNALERIVKARPPARERPISRLAHNAAVRFVEEVVKQYGPEGAFSRARMMTHEKQYKRRRPQWLDQSIDLLGALMREEGLKGQPLTEIERRELYSRRAP